MKKSLAASLIASGLIVSVAASAKDFTGPYIGASVGYSTGDVKEGHGNWIEDGVNPYTTIGLDSKFHSPEFGISLGYNCKFQNNAVIGFEFDNHNINDTANGATVYYDTSYDVFSDRLISSIKINNIQTLRLKGGFSFDKTFVYATAGLAHARVKRIVTQVDDGHGWQWFEVGASNKDSSSEFGYALGLGVEHELNDNISLTAKYIYSDFGKVKYTYHGYAYGHENYGYQNVKIDNSIVEFGVSYSF